MDNNNANNADEVQDGGLEPSSEEFDDFDLDFEDEENDLVPILSLSALFAAVVGAILVLIGRRRTREPDAKERLEEMLAQSQKLGKRGAKAAAVAVSNVSGSDLRSLLGDAIGKATDAAGKFDAGDVAKAARKATRNVNLTDLLGDALSEARHAAGRIDVHDTTKSGRKAAGRLFSRARHAIEDVDVAGTAKDVRKQAEDMLSGGRDAAMGFDVAATAGAVGKRASDLVSGVDIDRKGVENLLDTLKGRLSDAIDSVRNDIAPNAADRLKSDVLPVAQDMADNVATRVREDVLPAAHDAFDKVRDTVTPVAQNVADTVSGSQFGGQVGKMAGDLEMGKRARTIASAAGKGTAPVSDILRTVAAAVITKVIEDVMPQARKAGEQAVSFTRDEVIPTAAQAAGDTAQRVREDVLPKVAEVASQTPDVLSDLLGMARDRAQEALDKAQPVASDALEFSRHRAREAAEFSLHRARDAADLGRHGAGNVAAGARNVGSAAGGAVSSAGRGVGGAVNTAVGATVSLTKETTGLLFWLGTLGGLVLLIFVPDRERQAEIWNNTRQLLNEIREMWRDLQGTEVEVQEEA